MAAINKLLKLARDCYAQARIAFNPDAKRIFMRLGDKYLKEADELKHGRSAVHAVFPQPGSKIE